MLTITLADLRLQAQQRADMENSDFISDSEWLAMINASYAELYDLLVGKGLDYFVVPQAFAIDGNSDYYPLPANVYKLAGVDYQNSGQSYPMKKFIWAERFSYNSNDQIVRYRIVGSTIYFTPRAKAQSFTLWYVPPITRLANDSDTLDTINEWYEYIVIDAAIKARIKEESDITELMAQKQAQSERIEVMSANRDQALGERVTDVTAMNGPYRNLFFGER